MAEVTHSPDITGITWLSPSQQTRPEGEQVASCEGEDQGGLHPCGLLALYFLKKLPVYHGILGCPIFQGSQNSCDLGQSNYLSTQRPAKDPQTS